MSTANNYKVNLEARVIPYGHRSTNRRDLETPLNKGAR